MPRFAYSLFSGVIAGQMISYFEDQFSFYQELSTKIRSKLVVRLYHGDYKWNQRQRWLDKFPTIQFDNNTKMDSSVEQSRLIIATYSATTYNETLASNIPTIIFWDSNYWELNKISDPIFQKLKDKFSKKKEAEPKKQSQSDADFYKKQYAGRTGKELTRKEIKQYILQWRSII